jgi:hypothetical protein
MSNGTWEIVDHPYGCKPVGCKQMFKKKLRSDGTIEKYKARLVAKSYTRKKARTSLYLLTSGPIDHNRVLLALTASYGLLIHQMNVKTTFLNIELDEEIYMD